MKKLFKYLFSKNRIDLIQQNLVKKNPCILEIGIHKGDFSKQLISNFKPSKLILVDPWIAYDDLIIKILVLEILTTLIKKSKMNIITI